MSPHLELLPKHCWLCWKLNPPLKLQHKEKYEKPLLLLCEHPLAKIKQIAKPIIMLIIITIVITISPSRFWQKVFINKEFLIITIITFILVILFIFVNIWTRYYILITNKHIFIHKKKKITIRYQDIQNIDIINPKNTKKYAQLNIVCRDKKTIRTICVPNPNLLVSLLHNIKAVNELDFNK